MITFPNAKINLGLNVTAKRADGYHNLETMFYPIPLTDVLEVKESNSTTIHIGGQLIDGDPEDNLIVKAVRLMQEFHHIPQLEIFLQKNIPMGAGLGGGSADAAFMLSMINDFFKLELNFKELEDYAARLGADCAFFIQNRPSLAYGIGNELCHYQLSLLHKWIYLVVPNIHVSTAEAYAHVKPKPWAVPLVDIMQMPIKDWKDILFNDFEESVFKQHHELKAIKHTLYKEGAIYASMSGSGSSIYGIFEEEPKLKAELFPADAKLFTLQIPR